MASRTVAPKLGLLLPGRSRACKVVDVVFRIIIYRYGHKAFHITLSTVISGRTARTQHCTHCGGCAVELASALTAATILADAAVTPTVSEITHNVSSGTLNS